MDKTLDALDRLMAATGSNEKKAILAETKSEDLARIFRLAYDPFITFGISKVDIADIIYEGLGNGYTDLIQLFNSLSTRTLTGNIAREAIRRLIDHGDKRYGQLILNILKKDLRIGCGIRVINSVYKDLLPEDFCMSAMKYTPKKVEFPIYVDTKLDGVRCIALIGEDKITLFSRNGKEFKNYSTIEKEIAALDLPVGTRLDGEITMGHFQDLMRTVGRKDEGIELAKDAIYNIFDIQDSFYPLDIRQETLEHLNLTDKPHLKLVDATVAYNEEQLLRFYEERLAAGQEGVMIKPFNGMYEMKRSYAWQKMKPELTEDLEIIRAEEGLGKYEKQLGKVICRLENGGEVHVGSGFKDEERERLWSMKEQLVGRMIEIKFQEKTRDGSLRFPIFMRFRPDKE